MKKIIILALAVFLLPVASSLVYADMIEGSVQGYQCVTQGKTCPIGQEDPMAAAESTFVILSDSKTSAKAEGKAGSREGSIEGQKYYFVNNLDRNIMVRHINDRVRVYGKINPKYNSISATSFEVYRNGKWVKTWDSSMESDVWQQYFYPQTVPEDQRPEGSGAANPSDKKEGAFEKSKLSLRTNINYLFAQADQSTDKKGMSDDKSMSEQQKSMDQGTGADQGTMKERSADQEKKSDQKKSKSSGAANQQSLRENNLDYLLAKGDQSTDKKRMSDDPGMSEQQSGQTPEQSGQTPGMSSPGTSNDQFNQNSGMSNPNQSGTEKSGTK